jgi:hypothetical protein
LGKVDEAVTILKNGNVGIDVHPFNINHPDYGTITQNVPVTLPAGDSTVDYEYVSLQTILAIAGTCSDIVKTLNCGLLLSDTSCEFGTGITAC